MSKQIFINLVVSQLLPSMKLYEAMGFINNPQFSDDSAKCMVWSDHIYVMLMNADKMNSFATKPLANTQSHLAALYSLSVESDEAINNIMENALAQGGKEPSPLRDYGFMKQRTLEDFDGHTWEIFHMDMSKFPVTP
jgi:predicted lactoylglutathione lyase